MTKSGRSETLEEDIEILQDTKHGLEHLREPKLEGLEHLHEMHHMPQGVEDLNTYGSSTYDNEVDEQVDAALEAAIEKKRGRKHLHSQPDTDLSKAELASQLLGLNPPVLNPRLPTTDQYQSSVDPETGYMVTPATPVLQFDSREALMDYIKEFALINGFGIVIAHSNKKAIYFTCELGGDYRRKKSSPGNPTTGTATSPHGPGLELDQGLVPVDQHTSLLDQQHLQHLQQQQQHLQQQHLRLQLQQATALNGHMGLGTAAMNATKKTKCPFSMTANHKKSTRIWTLKTIENNHNHAKLDPLTSHPMLRKRSDELNMTIISLYKQGTKPLTIEKILKDRFPKILIKREDIYNEIRSFKRKVRMGVDVHVDDSFSMGAMEALAASAHGYSAASLAAAISNVNAEKLDMTADMSRLQSHIMDTHDVAVAAAHAQAQAHAQAAAVAAAAAAAQELEEYQPTDTPLENIDTRLVDGEE